MLSDFQNVIGTSKPAAGIRVAKIIVPIITWIFLKLKHKTATMNSMMTIQMISPFWFRIITSFCGFLVEYFCCFTQPDTAHFLRVCHLWILVTAFHAILEINVSVHPEKVSGNEHKNQTAKLMEKVSEPLIGHKTQTQIVRNQWICSIYVRWFCTPFIFSPWIAFAFYQPSLKCLSNAPQSAAERYIGAWRSILCECENSLLASRFFHVKIRNGWQLSRVQKSFSEGFSVKIACLLIESDAWHKFGFR